MERFFADLKIVTLTRVFSPARRFPSNIVSGFHEVLDSFCEHPGSFHVRFEGFRYFSRFPNSPRILLGDSGSFLKASRSLLEVPKSRNSFRSALGERNAKTRVRVKIVESYFHVHRYYSLEQKGSTSHMRKYLPLRFR